MKASGAPAVGDLVIALYDEERDITCTGLVVECRGRQNLGHVECRVLWGSESHPLGWWAQSALRVIHETR